MLRCSPADWTKKKEVKSSWEGNSDCETETDRNSLNGKRTELRCQAKCGKMSEKSSGSSESSATERQEGKWECERKAKMRMKRNGRGKERGGGGVGMEGESRERKGQTGNVSLTLSSVLPETLWSQHCVSFSFIQLNVKLAAHPALQEGTVTE